MSELDARGKYGKIMPSLTLYPSGLTWGWNTDLLGFNQEVVLKVYSFAPIRVWDTQSTQVSYLLWFSKDCTEAFRTQGHQATTIFLSYHKFSTLYPEY